MNSLNVNLIKTTSNFAGSCPECLSIAFPEHVVVLGEDWTRCSCCGYMEKVNKVKITPMRVA